MNLPAHPDIVALVSANRAEMPARDLWVLLVRSQLWERDGWLSRWLWRYRWAWGISKADRHCVTCGASMRGWMRADVRYCGNACRQKAKRCRDKGVETPFGELRAAAQLELQRLREDLSSFHEWSREHAGASISPPDLLSIDHLPKVPGRCGRGCRGQGCLLTQGGPCLFVGTRGSS